MNTRATEGLPGDRDRATWTLDPGTHLGPYRILEMLGEGGFGVVYLAQQEQPVRRRVALKVLRPGMNSEGVLARFEQEQQVLALMDHPNVARVFDAGATPSGLPYFVMEYVQGEPITAYCDRRRLSLRRRLELFIPVCEAVQHAHMKGIIHRDLKPSNVLIAEVEGRPHPKVIDFGVAKALSGRLTDRTLLTEINFIIGTPDYMSPEQAESSFDVDTRADVYSLGVMLYEALTGVLPFDPEDLRRAGRDGIRRHLREVEPPRPVVRLSSLTRARPAENPTNLEQIAASRHTDPGSLTRLLRSELEWIPLKAMRKDRSERYRSAADLAADIGNYLEGKPLLAGPESVAYRARKFIRRNRLPVAAAAGFIVLLAGATVVLAAALSSTRAAQREASIALGRATAENRKARAINEFVREMLGAANPGVEGRQVKVADLLDRAGARIDRTLGAEPDVAASMHETLGLTYQGLGLFPEAISHLRRTVETRRTVLGEHHPDTLIAMRELATIVRTRDQNEAESLLRKAIDGLRREQGEAGKETLIATFVLGQLYQEMGRLDECTRLLSEVAAAADSFPDSDRHAPGWKGAYAIILIDKGDLAAAEPLARDALRRAEIAFGPEAPELFWMLNVMGRWYQARAEFDKAEPLYRRAFESAVSVLGPEHPETVFWMHNFARILQEQKRNEESREVYLRMIPIQMKLNEQSQDTLLMLANYAKLCDDMDRDDEAEALFREVLERSTATMGPDHQNRLIWMNNLARLLDTTGRAADAEAIYRDLVERARRALPGQFLTALFERNYAGCLIQLGRPEEAEPLMLSAEKIIVASVPREHPHVKTSWTRLADLYDRMNQPEKARHWRDKLKELEVPDAGANAAGPGG